MKPAPHEAPAPRGTGPGQAPFFNCAACAKPRPMKGRVARRMYGLRTWVCAGCGSRGGRKS